MKGLQAEESGLSPTRPRTRPPCSECVLMFTRVEPAVQEGSSAVTRHRTTSGSVPLVQPVGCSDLPTAQWFLPHRSLQERRKWIFPHTFDCSGVGGGS